MKTADALDTVAVGRVGTPSRVVAGGGVPAAAGAVGTARLAFLDNLRYLMVLLVLVYHSVAAYATVAPHWVYHDTTTIAADMVRELFDVFMMPVLFFVAGYFGLVSLEKKGVWAFLVDKVRRLLVPWALAVLVILPLLLYSKADRLARPFWSYWLTYLSSFETRLRFSQAPLGLTTQAVYWFISLLFAFFIVLAFAYALTRRWRTRPSAARPSAPSTGSVLQALLLFGLLSSIAYAIVLLLVPDSSWFTLGMALEFQVTRLVPYAGCFAVGVYARSQGWFADGKPIGSLVVWAPVSLALAATYLLIGQPVFADTAGNAGLARDLLVSYAFVRSFLLLALLVLFLSLAARFWNRSSVIDRQLAASSYNIYLVHYFFVIVMQETLVEWTGSPVLAKIAVVFLVALATSYAVSRWVLARHARAFALVVMALFAFCLAFRP